MGNETLFAKHYIQANKWLMDAIAEPTSTAFRTAVGRAVLARDAAFGGIERDLGNRLIVNVRLVAERHGFKIAANHRVGA